MHNILITGASGMLGATLSLLWQDKYNIFATDHNDYPGNKIKNFKLFDLLEDSYEELIRWSNPDIIVHCAAMTNVDECENHPKQAMVINSESVNKILLNTCNIKVIFISSDAVFADGHSMATEGVISDSETIYGKSKIKAEQYLLNSGHNHLVIRTTIVGKNINKNKKGFVEWIVDSVIDKKYIILFNDVSFTPITIWHLAKEIEWCINNNISGLLHISGKNPITKFKFGIELCQYIGLNTKFIKKGNLNNIKFKSKRSNDQTISSEHYENISNRKMPSVRDTLVSLTKNFI
jgi:dTDP-4-dehydrorhamnose reductase